MVYDISENKSTEMAVNESLFTSCKTFKNDLTESEFRKNVDLAWRITQDFKNKKGNTALQPPIVDHEPCSTCGSTQFIKTGVCFTCSNCASSSSCS